MDFSSLYHRFITKIILLLLSFYCISCINNFNIYLQGTNRFGLSVSMQDIQVVSFILLLILSALILTFPHSFIIPASILFFVVFLFCFRSTLNFILFCLFLFFYLLFFLAFIFIFKFFLFSPGFFCCHKLSLWFCYFRTNFLFYYVL